MTRSSRLSQIAPQLRLRPFALVALTTLATACGGSSSNDGSSGGGGTGGSAGSGVGGVAGSGIGGSAGGTSCAPADVGAALGSPQATDYCTAVLWISAKYPTRASVSCGPSKVVTATEAEDLANPTGTTTHLGAVPEALPEAFVFQHNALDMGGIAVVSAKSGRLVMRIDTEYLSHSATAITPPDSAWTPPTSCQSTAVLPAAKGLALGGDQSPNPSPLDSSALGTALDGLGETWLADLLAAHGKIQSVLVLKEEIAGTLVVIESGPDTT